MLRLSLVFKLIHRLRSAVQITVAATLLLFLQACTNYITPPIDTDLLLSGEALFGETVTVEQPELNEILAIDDEMRAYVEDIVAGRGWDGSKLRHLISAMIDDGLLSLEYDANLSNSAIETFHSRSGNCLSFSNLFVVLAREAGLDVTFQLVDIPPSFSNEGDLVLLNKHINVLVKGIRSGPNFIQEHVVDFNVADYRGNYDTKRVSDNYVLALYHSNLAVEAMTVENYREAFEHLKRGLIVEPELAELWVNLGALYSRHQHYDLAIQAYHQALLDNPNNKSALVNLTRAHEQRGEKERADQFRSRIDSYQRRNPYYHYELAKTAYMQQDYELSLKNLNRAIRIKRDEHQFYYLKGLSQLQLSEVDAAEKSFKKARDTAQRSELERAYEGKLQLLRQTADL